MMDPNGHYEMKRQKYEDMLREAEQHRLAREAGFRNFDVLRSIAIKLRAWLSQITAREVASSDEARRLAASGISAQPVITNREKEA